MGLHSLSSVVLFAEKTYLKGADGRRIDLGLVGEVKNVNARLLQLLVQADSSRASRRSPATTPAGS